MQVQREHSTILSTFIKLPDVIKTFVLSIFEWPFYTGFTVVMELQKLDFRSSLIWVYTFRSDFSVLVFRVPRKH